MVSLYAATVFQACVLGGTLKKLFEEFQVQAVFLCVYLTEAHPLGRWTFGLQQFAVNEHTTIEDRQQVARLVRDSFVRPG